MIIRSRAKIVATIEGARIFLAMEQDGGFAKAMWAHVGGRRVMGNGHVLAKTRFSEAISKDRGSAAIRDDYCATVVDTNSP